MSGKFQRLFRSDLADSSQCENWEGVLPYLSGSSSCGYSTLASYIPPPTTTNTFDTMASFPYSMTLPNGAIIAYSSTTSIADAGPRQPWGGTGPSTTVQIGSVLTVQYDTDTSAQSVGTMTGDRLYTAISDALMTACPSPTSGSTVEACATPSPIKDIPYVSGSDLNTDGVLKFDIPFVGYSEPDIRIALIESIATAMNVSSLYPKNTETVSYGQPCYECVNTSPPTYKATLTRIPGAVQALFKVQDERTGGAVELNELQLQASFHLDTFDELFCSTAAFTADAIGALALIPPLDFLAVAAAPAALAFSLDCFLDEVETQPDD